MIGLGLLSIPNRLSSVGYSQWWFPVLMGILATLTLIPMVRISSKYKDDSLFKIHEILLGKYLGKMINGLIVIFGVLFMAGVVERYLEIIQIVVLPHRTITAHIIIFMLISIGIAKGGIKSIARFCIMTFFITGPMIFILRWAIPESEFTHLLPLFNFNSADFLKAIKEAYMSMVGYELIMFYFPYIIHQQKVFKQATLGIWINVFFYTAVSVVSVMHFSEWQLEKLVYPVLNLFKAVELSFMERIDTIGLTLYIFLILSTVSAYLWVLKEGVESIRSKKNPVYLYVIAAIISFIVYLPLSQTVQNYLYDNIFYFSYTFILWPILLCFLELIKSRKKKGTQTQ